MSQQLLGCQPACLDHGRCGFDAYLFLPPSSMRRCGLIFSRAALDRIGGANAGICPITGKAFEPKDVIDLVPGGTGYAGHDKTVSVESSVWRPSMR
jgi:hypothetical protein